MNNINNEKKFFFLILNRRSCRKFYVGFEGALLSFLFTSLLRSRKYYRKFYTKTTTYYGGSL